MARCESSDPTHGCCRIAFRVPQTTSSNSRVAISGKMRLDGVIIVDTHDGNLTPGMSIWMDMGRIISISPTSEVSSDPSVTSIDATGRLAIPGFNNMHMRAIPSRPVLDKGRSRS
jgi:adenine deaminase